MAEPAQNEAAKKQLAENKKASDKSKAASQEASKGKPTPTQEENDLAALGAHVNEKEDDGSGPDPHQPPDQAEHKRNMEGGQRRRLSDPASNTEARGPSRVVDDASRRCRSHPWPLGGSRH